MASSKKHNRTKRTPASFYEALPMAITPPAAFPQVADHVNDSALALYALWLKLIGRIHQFDWSMLWRFDATRRTQIERGMRIGYGWAERAVRWTVSNILWAGLTTTNTLIHAGRTGLFAARYGASTTRIYAPPLAADFAATARRLRHTLLGRNARALYLAIAAGGAFTLVIIGTLTAAATISSYANDISSPQALLAKKKTGTTILDRNGQVLFEGYGAQATQPVKLSDLPQSIKDATLAAEDPSFYDHPGFSWRATARAAWVDITHHGRVEGGSTLTQQLVKNALLTSDKKFQRKYQELLLAVQLEHHYTKDQILEMYLNEIYYGQGSSGVEAASQTYFHKPAHDLTLGESAMLAGLPLGPSRFDPNFDLEAATGRRDFVLSRMVEFHKITKAQSDAAKAAPIQLASAEAPVPATPAPMLAYAKNVNIKAPHFVFYVLNLLRNQYGADVVEQGGITVQTTLDLSKQQIAEKAVADHISALSEHHVTNGALISLEPSSGNIVALVGSADPNAPGGFNVVTQAERQPGSSFKPIAYATAFKKGYTGATVIDDAPISTPNGDGTMFTPQNYDLKFHGRVTLRHALDNSLNIPAVKVLQFAGIHDTIQTAHDMGITSLQDESRFGLSLVLGGGEVRPIDLATVYATFANNGTRVEPHAILKVTDRHGKDITKPDTTKPRPNAIDPRIAYMITNILSDDSSRQPEFPANGPLHLSRPAAAKTGTTNDFRDNWTAGYTPQLVTVVWAGNNDNSPMQNVDGITGAAPIWHDYMEAALAGSPATAFTAPTGITTASVCSDGSLADGWSTGTSEVFMTDAMPSKHCSQPAPPKPSDTPKPQDDSQKNDNPPADTPSITPEPTPWPPIKPPKKFPPSTL